jgi:hypothetical protein
MDYPELRIDKRTHDYLLCFAATVTLEDKDIYEFIDATKLLINHAVFKPVFKEHIISYPYNGQKMIYKDYESLLYEASHYKTVPVIGSL